MFLSEDLGGIEMYICESTKFRVPHGTGPQNLDIHVLIELECLCSHVDEKQKSH